MEKYAVVQEEEKKGTEKTAQNTNECKYGHGKLEQKGNILYCPVGGSECYEKLDNKKMFKPGDHFAFPVKKN